MNDEMLTKWLDALESDKYVQGEGRLRSEDKLSSDPPKFCCLGVLADVQGVDWEFDNIRYEIDELLGPTYDCGIDITVQQDLAHLNDNGYSFREIAAKIREYHAEGKL